MSEIFNNFIIRENETDTETCLVFTSKTEIHEK